MAMGSFNDIDYSYLGVEELNGAYPVKVSNVSPQVISYVLPELNGTTRTFAPATSRTMDTKSIQFHELYTLFQSPGGQQLIYDHLQIKDNQVRKALNLPTDPEFDYSYEDIKKLVQEGTEEEILDALEFGPFFIAQWMKNIVVTEGLNDYNKRKFFGGLFNMSVDEAQDAFEWSQGDPIVGAQYKQMSSKTSQGGRERRVGAEAQPTGRQRRAPKK